MMRCIAVLHIRSVTSTQSLLSVELHGFRHHHGIRGLSALLDKYMAASLSSHVNVSVCLPTHSRCLV